jgi:hypothetical protein
MTGSVAEAIRVRVENAPAGAFIRNMDIPGPRAAVDTALSRLSAAGELVRVRNGLYWKGVKSRFGSGRPGRLDVALAAAGNRGAGPSGWSASHALGLSTQLPATVEVAVAGPVPTLGSVRFHRRNNLARRDLNVWEIALLEVLRDYPAYTEASLIQVAERVASLAAEGKVRVKDTVAVARIERSAALHRSLDVVLAALTEDTRTLTADHRRWRQS